MVETLHYISEINAKLKEVDQLSEGKEIYTNLDTVKMLKIEPPDINFIETTPYSVLMDTKQLRESMYQLDELNENQKSAIKSETGWNDQIIYDIKNMEQYEILRNADLMEVNVEGRLCLMKRNIDLDYIDRDGISNRDRILRGLSPIDASTEKPIELHHLGQKIDSPLVELTSEEHRTGEYEPGKKNHTLWHSMTLNSEVHNDGSNWSKERKNYWIGRMEYY